MIEPLQLPILLKAIDFIFDEGRKILQERRERRKSESAPSEIAPAKQESELPPPTPQAVSKPVLLATPVDEPVWKDHEAEVQHLVRLLETYSRNYHISKEQYAKWGSALVPPIVLHNLNEAENAMLTTIRQLEAVLSTVYKKDIGPIE